MNGMSQTCPARICLAEKFRAELIQINGASGADWQNTCEEFVDVTSEMPAAGLTRGTVRKGL